MDSPYDSDVSEDTRDLISRGLASDTKKYNVKGHLGCNERESAPNRSMNTSYVHLPLTHVVKAEEPSARGLNMASGESVKDQNYNTIIVVRFSAIYYFNLRRFNICEDMRIAYYVF